MRILAAGSLLATALLSLSLSACKKPDVIDVGLNPPAEVGYTDTLTVEMRPYLLDSDSLFTQNQSYMILGSYKDPVAGRVTAEIYSQFSLAGEFVSFGTDATLDSIVLFLPIESYYGNTASEISLEVNELTDAFSTTSPYFAGSSISYDPTNLANGFTYGQDGQTFVFDTLKIRLPDELGTRILTASPEGPLANNTNFHIFFKGLRIAATPTQAGTEGVLYTIALRNLIASNQRAAAIRLFYKRGGVVQPPYNLTIVAGVSNRFNQIARTETAGTLLQQLLDGVQPQSSQYGLVQAMAPIRIRGFIPNLPSRRLAINRAILEVPVDDSYIDDNALTFFRPMPRDLLFVPALADSVSPDGLAGIESYANYNSQTRAYEFNVTAYLHQLLQNSPSFQDHGFLLLPPAFSYIARAGQTQFIGTTQRSVLTNRNHPTRPPRIRVFYTEIPQ